MVLQIPIAIEYFYEFLERQQITASNENDSNDKESPVTYFFSLYEDLRQFDKAVMKDVDPELLLEKAQEIRSDYLDPNGNYYVKVRPEVVAATVAKI